MSQTGYTPILIYGSSTASNVPLAANLTTSASGVELAINAADGKLFYKDSGGVVQVLATKATGSIGGSTTQVQYNLSGALAGSANMTFNGTRLSVADFADASLTSGRVTYATTSGNLTDSANLTFDGTTLTANALTTTSTVTINGGTANGVAYLNGSKVLTTGSALTFNGSTFGVNFTSSSNYKFYVSRGGTAGELAAFTDGTAQTLTIDTAASSILLNSANGGALAFGVTTEQMRLNSTGLGIGTSSPAAKLDVSQSQNGQTAVQLTNSNAGASAEATFIANNGTYIGSFGVAGASKSAFGAILASDAYIFSNANVANTGITLMANSANGVIKFATGGSAEKMRLDASGNLGLGTTNPGGSATARQLSLFGTTSQFSAQVGAFTVSLGNNATLGYVEVTGANPLAFYTNGSERARIDSSGNLLVGTTGLISGSERFALSSSASDWTQYTRNTNATPYGLRITYSAAAPNGTGSEFLYCSDNGPTVRATIRSNGGLANYSGNDVNLSDRREKTNFAPAKSYLDTICAIPVQTFNYIDQSEDDPGLTLGVVAQDVQAVAPELVMESNWGSKDDPKMRLSIYQTDLQYALMKALQELKAEFDAYKATHP